MLKYILIYLIVGIVLGVLGNKLVDVVYNSSIFKFKNRNNSDGYENGKSAFVVVMSIAWLPILIVFILSTIVNRTGVLFQKK